jgi:hemoglobin-like flavoprotein
MRLEDGGASGVLYVPSPRRRTGAIGTRAVVPSVETIEMLTSTEIALVRASFARVARIQETAADLFYDRLFAIAPKLRELFPADLQQQKRKLMQTISTAVGGLDDLDKLVPVLKALGARHAGYGATAADYAVVGEALLWTLEQGLGEEFQPGLRAVWAKAYDVIATTMQAGAAEGIPMRAAE